MVFAYVSGQLCIWLRELPQRFGLLLDCFMENWQQNELCEGS